jgi:hypothetical protein
MGEILLNFSAVLLIFRFETKHFKITTYCCSFMDGAVVHEVSMSMSHYMVLFLYHLIDAMWRYQGVSALAWTNNMNQILQWEFINARGSH